ncbi:MAG: hypothetical protein NC236_00415 [Mycoplasma sp.]|nr:hypothetical protein [Mycoplasma sp.]
MKLKYYLQCINPSKATKLYVDLFQGKINKQSGSDLGHYHANLTLFNNISIYVCNDYGTGNNVRPGYIIISFDKNERDLYNQTRDKILQNNELRVTINDQLMRWGWRITEFLDPYGYHWDIEIED